MDLRQSDETVLYSHRMALLPGLMEQGARGQLLSANSVIQGCLNNLDLICGSGDLPFITRLPVSSTQPSDTTGSRDVSASTSPPQACTPSHVLYRHRAYALHQGLGFALSDDSLLIDSPSDPAFSLVVKDGKLALEGDRSQIQSSGDLNNLVTGDSLLIGNQRLDLIEVTCVAQR